MGKINHEITTGFYTFCALVKNTVVFIFLTCTHALSQVWFQNARAKLRRSLTADDSQVNSPSAPSRCVTMATSPPPPACSPLDQSQPFPSSTIDHLQLSLLTTPLGDPPVSPAVNQPLLQNPDFFLDYNSQSASGCISSLEAYGDAEGGAEREVDPDSSYQPHYC